MRYPHGVRKHLTLSDIRHSSPNVCRCDTLCLFTMASGMDMATEEARVHVSPSAGRCCVCNSRAINVSRVSRE